MQVSISFKDQLVLVTGGTRGIGRALVERLAACEARVLFTGTGEAPPDWLPEFRTRHAGQMVDYQALDLRREGWIDSLEKLAAQHPDISVCINNAGMNIVSDIRETRPEDLSRVLEVNLTAPALITSRLARGMAAKKYGRIVNISSIFGIASRAGRASYSASKSGLIGLTRAAALDLAGDNVLVNAVCPGFVSTDLTRRVLGEKGMAEVAGQIPLGRLADPQEIAPAVLFLASPLNTYITGQTLVVDGGFLLA